MRALRSLAIAAALAGAAAADVQAQPAAAPPPPAATTPAPAPAPTPAPSSGIEPAAAREPSRMRQPDRLPGRPSGFWLSNRAATGGAYRYHLLLVGAGVFAIMALVLWRVLRRHTRQTS